MSPLAAYHAPSRRFLVLDVWPDTGPCWLGGARLWAALVSTDAESGNSRGWLEVDFAYRISVDTVYRVRGVPG